MNIPVSITLGKISIEEYLDFEEFSENKHEYYDGIIVDLHADSIESLSISPYAVAELTMERYSRQNEALGSPKTLYSIVSNLQCYLSSADDTETLISYRDNLARINPCVIIDTISTKTLTPIDKSKVYLYKSIPSLKHYLILAQDSPHAELYTRHNEKHWTRELFVNPSDNIALFDGLATFTLNEIYNT